LKAAGAKVPVLVYGDTGTGKELFIHSIHNSSPRRYQPFIAQNCAAFPPNLLEGILFGTVKGGFTWVEYRAGLFELAHGGSLFLDEINSMPIELQSKLLRALQDGTIRRVGGTNTIDVDVRILTATNIRPEEAVKKNQLREDLYYRLNVISLEIPPLRERKEDITILTKFFIDKFNKKMNRSVKDLSNEVKELFLSYSWKGNVRELEHLLEGIMSIYDVDVIELKHLPRKFKDYKEGIDLSEDISLMETLDQIEEKLILKSLKMNDYNITHTAKSLKIPRQTLQYKMKKHGLAAEN